MKADIVERLQTRALLKNVAGGSPLDEPHLASEAADEIVRLRRRAARLESALQAAVEAAYRSGAGDWVRLHHPDAYKRLSK